MFSFPWHLTIMAHVYPSGNVPSTVRVRDRLSYCLAMIGVLQSSEITQSLNWIMSVTPYIADTSW